MRVTITARHCDVAPELRERARALVVRLAPLLESDQFVF